MRGAVRKKVLVRRKPRQNSTGAEMKLWLALRARRLGGFKFARRASVGRYVVGFACREKYLAVEIDDGPLAAGRRDRVRDFVLLSKGYFVVRFSHAEVLNNIDGVLERLYAELCAR